MSNSTCTTDTESFLCSLKWEAALRQTLLTHACWNDFSGKACRLGKQNNKKNSSENQFIFPSQGRGFPSVRAGAPSELGLSDLLSVACLFCTRMNIEGNNFHLIVNYYAFIFLNTVVFKMNTSMDLNVEIRWQRKINFKMLITKVQKKNGIFQLPEKPRKDLSVLLIYTLVNF